jgi:hypothetical protein
MMDIQQLTFMVWVSRRARAYLYQRELQHWIASGTHIRMPSLTSRPIRATLIRIPAWRSLNLEPNRAYVKNASAPLTIPTYDASGQAIHPDVIDFGSGNTWNGYRYWMAMTPYTGGDNTTENPSIVVSTDGQTWIVPPGLTNPVVPYTGSNLYNADTDIIMVGSTMWMIFKYVSVAGTTDQIKYLTSTDGITWSAQTVLLSWCA